MTKPEWCPQDVWEATKQVLDGYLRTPMSADEAIAKAIIAERQRCFRIALGVVNDWERGAKSTPEEKFAAAEGAKAARVVASRIHSGAHN